MSSLSTPWITHFHPIDLTIFRALVVYCAELVLVAFDESLVGHLPGPTTIASLDVAHLARGVVMATESSGSCKVKICSAPSEIDR
jgi:hypothetical protein